MIFSFLKKLLLPYGLHPDRMSLWWQRALRTTLQVIMVFITIPQLRDVIVKVSSGSDVTSYALDIMYFSYNVSINIQFFLFIRNFDRIAELMNFISSTLSGDARAYAEGLENRFLKFCKVSITLTFLSYFFGVLDLLTSTSEYQQLLSYNRYFAGVYTPIHVVLYVLHFSSLVGNDLAHMCMLICYFNLCVHVVSLYHKLKLDILKLEDAES